MIRVSQNKSAISEILESNQISAEMFGDIYTTFTTTQNYLEEGSEYNLGAIRWPGGTLTESKFDSHFSYSLTNPSLIASTVKDLSDRDFPRMLKIALDLQRDFATVIPTYPYFNNVEGNEDIQEALEVYRSDLSVFFDFLSEGSGEIGVATEFFENGHNLILEIGNETSHLGWSGGIYSEDWNYGKLAHEVLEYVQDNHTQISENVKMSVQMGVNSGGAQYIIKELNGSKTGQENLLGNIDYLISHSGLAKTAEAFDYTNEYDLIQTWKTAFEQDGDPKTEFSSVTLYASAWSIGSSSFGIDILDDNFLVKTLDDFADERLSEKAQYQVYENYLNELKSVGDFDIGARQAAATLDVFAKLVSLGFEEAALWGTVDPYQHSNSYQNFQDTGSWNGISGQNDFALSFGGEVMRMLAEDVPESVLLKEGAVASIELPNEWRAEYFDWNSGENAGIINSYLFANDDEYIVFSSSTDLDGWRSTSAGSHVETYNFSEIAQPGSIVSVEAITTEFDYVGWRKFKAEAELHEDFLTFQDDILEFRRLFETPVVKNFNIEIDEKGEISYEFTSDYEVVKFIVEIDQDLVGVNFEITGTTSSDFLVGTEVDERISGVSGSDIIKAVGGNNLIDAGSGVDLIFCGEGVDSIILSDNTDFDVIYDFDVGVDKIFLVDAQFENLRIEEYRNNDVIIYLEDEVMVLKGIESDMLDSGNFVLA